MGRKHIPSDVGSSLSAEHMGQVRTLTPRELEVLELIRRRETRTSRSPIRLAGYLSETTVNFHIKNIVDKLQANDRTHAVTIALRRGFAPDLSHLPPERTQCQSMDVQANANAVSRHLALLAAVLLLILARHPESTVYQNPRQG